MLRNALLLAASAAMLLLAACDDDGDDGDTTPTPAVTAAPTAAPTATPAVEDAITIDTPLLDEEVAVPITMTGTADVFEAALTIDALGNAAGLVLCTRHLMASSGTGTRGDWSGVLAFTPLDTAAPVTLRAYSFSPMDGSMENVVERTVIVQPERPNIVITSPACNEEVSGATLTVEGMAEVFEAALVVELRDAAGTVVAQQSVMAASGVEFSPWTATFDISALSNAFFDVVAYSTSPMDGSVINVFPVQISRGP